MSDDNWHGALLGMLASILRPASYLELGLSNTPAMLTIHGHCNQCYGVDHGPPLFDLPPNAKIFTMATDTFFALDARHIAPPNLVFVDADHRAPQVLKDLHNIAAICADNAIVVCHDTYPQNRTYTSDDYCADSYLVPGMIPWEHVTIPRHPGATILRMKPVHHL